MNEPAPALKGLKVLIRGAGEMASGVAHCLARSGFRVVMTEIAQPLAVRRAVCFCEAVYDGAKTVAGLSAQRVDEAGEVRDVWAAGDMAVIVDPDMDCRSQLNPAVIVDALLAKRNVGFTSDLAPLTMALGPGFTSPDDAHVVIETKRGHDLGRHIFEGAASPNTGRPGNIAGYTHERVLRAPGDGKLEVMAELGDQVAAGQAIARVTGREVHAEVGGVLRGLIRPGTMVKRGLKIGDVDPRGRTEYLATISEKARAIGGSVLEGIMHTFNR